MMTQRSSLLFSLASCVAATTAFVVYSSSSKSMTSRLQAKESSQRSRLFDQDEISPEAALSASLYMTPETITVAPSVKVTWEPKVAQHIVTLRNVSNPHRPLMVGLVGIPGSGKTVSSDILAQLIGKDRCLVMPMDGYHYSMTQLMEFPHADDAIYRRGACDTFDAATLAKDLERVAHGKELTVSIPGFDHAKGDPTPNQHHFDRNQHDIVICEGLYLLHDQQGWEHIQKFLDWTIYIEADIDVCMERLKERNKCIPGYTPEEIEIRCDAVDRVNAILAAKTASKYTSQIVQSGAVY